MNVLFAGNTATGKDEWLTPPELIKSLGEFDLDPCSPIIRPWETAKNHFNINDNGLMQNWYGRVWCNPPYGKYTGQWLQKAAMHQNTMCLIFARTETVAFFNYVWHKADAVFFIRDRLSFYHSNGKKGDRAGSPSVLVAYGQNNVEALRDTKIKGYFIELKNNLYL